MRRKVIAVVLAIVTGSAGMLGLTGHADRAAAVTSLKAPPAGSNNWDCKPTAEHPDPVVLVHGLGATMALNWFYFSPLLAKHGYCVFAFTYGIDPRMAAFGAPGGTLPIQDSAVELGDFVHRVLQSTGARQVDLVGHSEGTYMPQYWLKFLGGATEVDKYVAMAPLYGGTNVLGLAELRDYGEKLGLSPLLIKLSEYFCGSCEQFLRGSPMQLELSQGGAAAPGVDYTTIMTKYDELVVPYTSGYLPGAHNFVLQDVCPNDLSEHGAVAGDPVAAQITLNALDPAHAQPITCRSSF